VSLSRFLSTVLRHEPDLAGLELDSQGWVRVEDLIEGVERARRKPGANKRARTLPPLTRDSLRQVVASNDKQRFALSPDGERIRAVQGHSVSVDLKHPIKEPPPVLFHGTAAENWNSIAVQGLKRGTRHAVHLSPDAVTARKVGARHGRPIVLLVASGQMHTDGFQFSQADNGVWLVSEVPPRYLRKT
jgi:putative RNA 2'-phosphotransferase